MAENTKTDELQEFHPSHCDKFEVLRGIYPNNRRDTGKPCSCGFDEAIKQYGIQERIDGGREALNGVSCHAAMGGRKTVDISWLMSKDAQEWVQYWLENDELTALKDKQEKNNDKA